MSLARSSSHLAWPPPKTPSDTIPRPLTAPRLSTEEHLHEQWLVRGVGPQGPTGVLAAARGECRDDSPQQEGRLHHRPPPLALHPPLVTPSLTTSPLKRRIDQVHQDDQDSTQAEAGYSRDFGDISAADICVCQPPSSARRTPRPRNPFILYRQASAHTLAMKNPGMSVPEASRVAGQSWRALSEADKQPWKDRAEEEKRKHQEEHPNYRYQPRRNGRKSSIAESPTTIAFSQCNNCGKYPMVNPLTSAKSETFRPAIPRTPPSASFTFGNRQLPPMQAPPLPSPNRRESNRHYSSDIHIPPINQNPSFRGRESLVSPDSKRKRFSNGSIGHVPIASAQQQTLPPYNMSSPSRSSFAHPAVPPQYVHAPRPPVQPSAPPTQAHLLQQPQGSSPAFAPPQSFPSVPAQKRGSTAAGRAHDDMLVLPKDQQDGKSMEEILKGGSVREQLKVLGMVSLPLQETKSSQHTMRGAAIAVEGDNLSAVQTVAEFLEQQLSRRGDFCVRLAHGPQAPPHDQDVTIQDYRDLASIWHNKGQELIKYMTDARPQSNTNSLAAGTQTEVDIDPRLPVVIFNRYSHFASIAWASRVPLEGMYEPKNNWLWFATQWRGIIGPDFTIYVRDVGSEYLSQNANVEVCKDVRTIFVSRDEDAEDAKLVDDKTLRRLEFEVSEYIGDVSHMGERSDD